MIALVICILVTIGLGTIISMIIEAANEILDYIATSIRKGLKLLKKKVEELQKEDQKEEATP